MINGTLKYCENILKCKDINDRRIEGCTGDCDECPIDKYANGDCTKIKTSLIELQNIAKEFIYNNKPNSIKTFQEVVRDIKENEIWEVVVKDYTIESITLLDGHIILNSDEGSKEDTFLNINPDVRFKLQRKKVSFTEAFAAYEEGKEIESDYNGDKFKLINGLNYHDWGYKGYNEDDLGFGVDEIRGKWYINE
ncbi:MAG: hypothetical protein ACRDD7_09365 [Peptostreptococcaceae bacterium]